MIILFALGCSIFLFAIILLWFLVPAVYGLPSVPTAPERIQKALKLANLQQGETLYDLGAGDGRVLFIAVRNFGAHAVGMEIGPLQCAWIWLRTTASGFGSQIQVRWENYYKADLRDADVVFIYATSKEVTQIASHLERQMKPGSRLVSISADFSEWEPARFDERDLIFVYEMPPVRGNIATYMLKQSK